MPEVITEPSDVVVTAFVDSDEVVVVAGDDAIEARRQALLADARAAAAALSEAAALAAANYRSTIAAGVADFPVGSMFTSNEGGAWNYYLRTGTGPFYSLYRAVLSFDASGNLGVGGAASEKGDFYGTVQARAQKAFSGVGYQPFLVLADSNAAFAEVRFQGVGGAAYILTGGALRWNWATDGHYLPEADNAYNIGSGARRAGTIYAATGTINTSDAREKVWRGGMTAAELRAARRIAGELGFFQWTAAIAAKGGDNARLHFGARAQAVWEIMADEGLVDPIGSNGKPGSSPYAFLCFDEWEAEPAQAEALAEDGSVATPARAAMPAGHRFGLRHDQLALFLLAAQEARLAALEGAGV